MDFDIAPLTDPAWAALISLSSWSRPWIDNLIFISILTNKLPEENRAKARNIGISLALVMRLALLGSIAWLVGLDHCLRSGRYRPPDRPPTSRPISPGAT
jgi:hypothetical protein